MHMGVNISHYRQQKLLCFGSTNMQSNCAFKIRDKNKLRKK